MDNDLFQHSLQNNKKELFDQVSKGDLHTHGLLSSNRHIFEIFFPTIKLEKFSNSNNINSLSLFIKNNIVSLSTTIDGHFKLIECSIITAIEDGITQFDTSIDYRLTYELFDNNIDNFINEIQKLKSKYSDILILNFDLGISRNAYKKEHFNIISSLIKSNTFNGIDLFGDELSKSIVVFKKIYKIAKKQKMILKAHVGEFGNGYDVFKAIKILKLDVVQHGISIIERDKYIKLAKKKKVIFNVCPISNLKLNITNDIKLHPIRKMFDAGLIITINTDDQLIFENSLYDEYHLLYEYQIFSIDELNVIRMQSKKDQKLK